MRKLLSLSFLSIFFIHSPSSFSQSKEEALKGGAKAQLAYGLSIREKNEAEARIFIQKAADQGSGEAWYWLGYGFVGKEPPSYYYEKAAELGYDKAFPELFESLLFRAGNEANVSKAKKYADLAKKFKINLGEDSQEELTVIDRCFEAGEVSIPKADLPSEEEKKIYSAAKIECDDFFTGIGNPKDLKKYAKCLLSSPEPDNNFIAELYANGWGVERNPKIAMALVCHGSEVPTELISIVTELYEAKGQNKLKTPFVFCDHAISGMTGGFCSRIIEGREQKKRNLIFNELISKWNDEEKKAFQEMKTKAEQFFSEHATKENDMTGTARATIAIEIKSELRSKLLKDLKGFESGKLPSDQNLQESDKKLNELYSALMKRKSFEDWGTVNKDGIKSTQRLWIKYRDAWTKFAVLKYQGTKADDWNAWMTSRRNEQLKSFTP